MAPWPPSSYAYVEEMTYDDYCRKNKYRLVKYVEHLGTILEHVSKNNNNKVFFDLVFNFVNVILFCGVTMMINLNLSSI